VDTVQDLNKTKNLITDDDPRCAHSRKPHPQTGECGDDQTVDPQVEDTTTTTAAPAADPNLDVAGGGEQARPAPEQVLGGEVERPSPAETNMAPVGGSLPRTGAGIGDQVTLAFGLVVAGIAILRTARRRRPAKNQG
jgi:LPXTG-motif cell wall-anchored protein